MAKMIPTQIDDEVLSSAERRIFDLLDTDPDTNGWTVLHSLGLARRRGGPYGEIDFVVIIPGEGIVCLEIKGGRVSCENGVWRTQDRHERLSVFKKSPFMQARESMFALRTSMVDHFGQRAVESRCPIACAVVFPDIHCPPRTPEFERSDVIDSEDLRRPVSASIMRVAQRRLRQFQPPTGERYPSPSQCRAIQNYLRPNFDLVVAKSASLARTEAKLMSLTEEQYDRLDELENNPRCLFEGAAGTGKTLLALEYTRRANDSGAKVLLVCFNRLLGGWLQRQTEGTRITTGPWYEILRGIIVVSSMADEFLAYEERAVTEQDVVTLFKEVYPVYAEIAMEEMPTKFDVLVMDEAQDLCNKSTLDLANRVTRGGLAGGRWAIFGDFTRQALYDNSTTSIQELSHYSQHFVRAKLTLNCRNTRRIAQETATIAGFSTPPFRLGKETGMPVEHRYWRTPADLSRALTESVRRLLNDGIPLDDMMILSPRRLENSALATVKRICNAPLVDCSRSMVPAQNCIRFATVHAFKGLESRVVIIVDIDQVDDERYQALLYVGMSRARGLLVLMVNEQARKSVDARIRTALEKEFQT